MADYYVATTGNDTTGDGSESLPWLTVLYASTQITTGDVLSIKEGLYHINSKISFVGGIDIHGAGKSLTTLAKTGTSTDALISINATNGLTTDIGYMTLVGIDNEITDIQDQGIELLNSPQDFRIHHLTLKRFGESALHIQGLCWGVVDHCDFIDNFRSTINNLGYGIVIYGDGSWEDPLTLGGSNAVFMEDNYFYGNRHSVASNNASKYVFRYNTVVGTDPVRDFAQTDAHGKSTWPRGSRSYEVYDNVYYADISSGLVRTAVGIRGGDGVIYNNTMAEETISRPIELDVQGFSCGDYPGPDQTRSLYMWNNSDYSNFYCTDGLDNNCPSSIEEDRDYFLYEKSGYTPYTYPHPLASSPDGTEWIEAESMTIVSPMVIVADAEASGGNYIHTPTINSGTATVTFNLAIAGIYKIEAEVYAESNVEDSMFVTVDSEDEQIWDFNPGGDLSKRDVYYLDEVTKRGTGGVDTPQYDPYTIYLSSGDHTIVFRGREFYARLDRIKFSILVDNIGIAPIDTTVSLKTEVAATTGSVTQAAVDTVTEFPLNILATTDSVAVAKVDTEVNRKTESVVSTTDSVALVAVQPNIRLGYWIKRPVILPTDGWTKEIA